jgi:RNA polymerase sigma-70 factor (ECF subfamily)
VTIGDDFASVITQARTGDRDALAAIYRDTAPLVLGFARSRGAVDPEDVTSEVFVSMVRGIGGFTGDEADFRSWLFTIAHHRVVDSLRRQGRRQEDPVPTDELGERVLLLTDGESEAMQRLQSMGVLAAIDQLTEDQRAVLLLRVLADLSVKEIAAAVGKPESAVKALLRRATASLGRLLSTDREGA